MKKYNVTVNGETFAVEVEEIGAPAAASAPAAAAAPAPAAAPAAAAPAAAPVAAGANAVESPLPGTILRVNVKVGDAVKTGDVLLVLEAMKMENDICAMVDGTVSAIHVNAGQTVQTGDALVSL